MVVTIVNSFMALMPPCLNPLQATVGTNRYPIVTAGGALIVFPGRWPRRPGPGPGRVVHRRLGPGNDGNAEGPQGRGLTACRAPRRAHKLLICANPLHETRNEPHARGGQCCRLPRLTANPPAGG
jgi:hypothetical protein